MSKTVQYTVTVDSSGVVTGFDTAGKSVQGFEEKLKQTGATVEKHAGVYIDANGRMRDANGKFIKSGTEVVKVGDEIATTGTNINNSFGRMVGGFTIAGLATAGLTSAFSMAKQQMVEVIKVGAQFQSNLNELSAITGIVGSDLTFLADSAKENAQSTGVALDQQVQAYKLLASNIEVSTIGGAKGLRDLQLEVIKLSQAAGVDLTIAANTVASTLNQFSLAGTEASRVVNVLAAGSKFGAAEVADLSESLKQAGTTAALAGQSVETAVAALEVMSQNALKGAEAGTGLRNVLTILQTETEKLAKAGITNVNLQIDGLATTLVKLTPLLSDATLMVDVFGRENMNAAQILIANAKAVSDMESKVTDTQTALEQATIQTQGFESAQRRLKAALDSSYASLFQKMEPVLTRMVNVATSLLPPTESLSAQTLKLATNAAKLEKDFLPLLSRYEVLIGKTKINKKEQSELDGIIKQLAGVLPAATLQFDKYGEAIGINAQKARAFIKQQQELAAFANRDFASKQIKQIAALSGQLQGAQLALDQLNKGMKVKSTSWSDLFTNGGFASIDKQSQVVRDLANELKLAFVELDKLNISLDDVEKLRELGIRVPEGLDLKKLADELGVVLNHTNKLAEGPPKPAPAKGGKSGGSASGNEDKAEIPDLNTILGLRKAIGDVRDKYEKSNSVQERANYAKTRQELEEKLRLIEQEGVTEEVNLNSITGLRTAIAAERQAFEAADNDADRQRHYERMLQLQTEHDAKMANMDAEGFKKQDYHNLDLERQQEIMQVSADMTAAMSNLSSSLFARRLQSIEREKRAILNKYDVELDKEGLTDQRRQQILQQREAAERQYEERIRAEKKKSAIADKIFSASQVGFRTAMAVMSAMAMIPPRPGLALAAKIMGGIQLAAIAAQPIPYADGGIVGNVRAYIDRNAEKLGRTTNAFRTGAFGLSAAIFARNRLPKFNAGGTIPVMVSNGEYYFSPELVAQNLSLLQYMNESPENVRLLSSGRIIGPGTGTSDSIAAVAQPGSFILNAASSKEFEKLSTQPLSSSALRFNMGGVVGNLSFQKSFEPVPAQDFSNFNQFLASLTTLLSTPLKVEGMIDGDDIRLSNERATKLWDRTTI